jgi:hypothetical protein
LRRLAADYSVDDRDQGIHALIATLGGFRELLHAEIKLIGVLGEFIDPVGQDNLRDQQLPVFVPEVVARSKVILDQKLHQLLHPIQARFTVSVCAFFGHVETIFAEPS